MKRSTLILLIIVLIYDISFAQNEYSQSKNLTEDIIENSAEAINETGQFEIPEELMDLIHRPLDINKDALDILVRFNLLNQSQLNSIEEYKLRMGNLIEMEELQQVDDLDKKTIQSILPYCTTQSLKKDPVSQQFTVRFQKALSNISNDYSGSDSKIIFKYRGAITPFLKISYTGEKDAGEEFLTKNKIGFDFNSANVSYIGNSFIKKIIVGDYNLEFGQGLTLWSGFSFGGGNEITGVYKFGRGIIPYSGTDENRFLRGIAISAGRGKIRVDSWASYHAIDGNEEVDSVENKSYVTSLQTSGYHRTNSEIQDYHSLNETMLGTSVNFSNKNLITGIVFSFQRFSVPIIKSDQPYSKNEFSGDENYNVGWSYSITKKNMLAFGENSYCQNNSFAFLNGILMSVDPRLSFSFLWRYYSEQYINLKSNAFGVNSSNQNETGNYLGLSYKINKAFTYSGYVDIYSFPFLKYRTDQPSSGYEFFQQIQFIPNKKFTSSFRYRKRLKQLNDSEESLAFNKLSSFTYNSFRFSSRYKIDNTWEYAFRVELVLEDKSDLKVGEGTMISQDLFFHPMGKSYSLNFRYAIFNCPYFDTRIYEYENDVQGAFSIPFYYGSGSRFYTNINYKLMRWLTISIRYAITWVDDESSTSEIKLQLKSVFR